MQTALNIKASPAPMLGDNVALDSITPKDTLKRHYEWISTPPVCLYPDQTGSRMLNINITEQANVTVTLH